MDDERFCKMPTGVYQAKVHGRIDTSVDPSVIEAFTDEYQLGDFVIDQHGNLLAMMPERQYGGFDCSYRVNSPLMGGPIVLVPIWMSDGKFVMQFEVEGPERHDPTLERLDT